MFAELVERLIDTDDDTLTTRLRDIELEQRRLAAEQAALVTEVTRRGLHCTDGHRHIGGFLKANLNWSDQQVRTAKKRAKLLDTVAGCGDALHAGHIGVAQADELARLRANPRVRHRLGRDAAMLLDDAEQLSFKNFRTAARHWEALADEDGAHDDRVESRTASVLDINGELFMNATGGTATEVAELVAVFDQFVEREFRNDAAEREERFGPNAPSALLARTDPQRRRDAMQEVFRTAAAALADGYVGAPLPTTLNIVVSQYDLEHALADAGLIPPSTDLAEPAIADRRRETSTGSVVSEAEVVKAAIHGKVRRVLTDSKGVIIDFGRERRLFTGPMRVAAKLMGHTCSHPGCDIPSTSCEIDHLREFVRDHGPTSLANADLDCTSHNRHKHRAGLTRERLGTDRTITRRADGTAMLPVGRRIPTPDRDDPDDDPDALTAAGFSVRTIALADLPDLAA